MKIEELNKEYITENQEEVSECLIKKYEEKIQQEQILLRKKRIIEEIFVSLLNAQPHRKDGKWIVSGIIKRDKEKVSNYSNYQLAREDREDLEYASGFLTACDIPNRIDFQMEKYVDLSFYATLEERDQLEQFMVDKKQEKILTKIKI